MNREEIIWKAFKLGDLFEFNSGNQLNACNKDLDISEEKTDEFKIALVSQTEKNNGVIGYIEESEETSLKKMKGYMTYSLNFGICFYHDYDYALADTHGSIFSLIPKNENLKNTLLKDKIVNYFLAKMITKICKNGVYNYGWKPNSERASREIILLPLIKNDIDFVFEENGEKFRLASDYISYLYIQSNIQQLEKKVNEHKNIY